MAPIYSNGVAQPAHTPKKLLTSILMGPLPIMPQWLTQVILPIRTILENITSRHGQDSANHNEQWHNNMSNVVMSRWEENLFWWFSDLHLFLSNWKTISANAKQIVINHISVKVLLSAIWKASIFGLRFWGKGFLGSWDFFFVALPRLATGKNQGSPQIASPVTQSYNTSMDSKLNYCSLDHPDCCRESNCLCVAVDTT